ncbi:MAG TPA: transposase [Bacteroidales bacterium]|nr:transposase [Bacteroidales bacterium]
MELNFKTLDPDKFSVLFSTDEECMKYLSEKKWEQGFTCRFCGHTNYCTGRTPYSRRCTRCKKEESATAHTIFHRCHIPLNEAFRIAFLVCNDPAVSTYELSRKIELRQMTCWKLKKRLTECLERKGELDILFND